MDENFDGSTLNTLMATDIRKLSDARIIPEYAYNDLPLEGTHIRLLKVEPGEREDFIHCHLEPTTLEAAKGTYECISYVWGSIIEIRRILVDGHWIYVTLNLSMLYNIFDIQISPARFGQMQYAYNN